MIVLPIKSEEVEPWLLQKHYAKRLPCISFAFGLYKNFELVGIVTYGIPASNSLCEGICGKDMKHHVLELNRLCLLNNEKNESSFLVANSIKMLPKPKIIVSYADTAFGHIGYVYQATNFLFTGTTKERTDMFSGVGKHSMHATNTTLRQIRSANHRYVFFHGTYNDKKIFKYKLNYVILNFPKGITKHYDSGGKVKTQELLFL